MTIRVPGVSAYLGPDERAFIAEWTEASDFELMNDTDLRWCLWQAWWTHNKGNCDTCGHREGQCNEITCVRLRVTHILGLHTSQAWLALT